MKDRKPFQFKNTLIAYNFIQVLISVYLFTEVSFVVNFVEKWKEKLCKVVWTFDNKLQKYTVWILIQN